MSCSEPSIGSATARKSCRYVPLIVRGGGSGSGVMLNSIRCLQQSTSSLGSRSEESMGLRGLFGEIDPFEHVTISTISTTSSEHRSVGRNEERPAVTTPRLNLGWIHSRTMTRMRQVSIPFPVVPWSESVLQHCTESTFMSTPDDTRGRPTETPHGPGLSSHFALELTIPLSDEDGTHFLSMLVGN